ncbi:MAG TPA: hypothetical protein VGE45_12170 [Chloroflexia bacterium]
MTTDNISQIERQAQDSGRAAYLAGDFDALSGLMTGEQRYSFKQALV